MVSHRSLSDSKSAQVSKTLLSVLADLNKVWIVFTRPLISKSFNPYTDPMGTVPRAPITIGLTVTFKFHSFFISLARPRYLFFSLSFDFTLWSARSAKSITRQVLFFLLLIISRSDRLAEIRWSVCISKSQRNLCVLFSRTDFALCIYHLFAWSM